MKDNNQPTILIVEDDHGVAHLEQRRLARAGYATLIAPTPQAALDLLKQNQVALILLDYRLPGNVDGLDFYTQIKALGLDLPVILVTGFGNEATVIRALRIGVRDFVTKSLEYLDYLPEAVDRVLRQVHTEKQLAESEARLASIINSAKDAVLVTNTDRLITLINPAAEKMFRCPANTALGQPLSRFIPMDFPMASLTQCVGTGLRGLGADGEEFPLEASIAVGTGPDGGFFTIIVRDITERRRDEQRIREQADLLDKANDAILVSDLEDRIQFWNKGAARIYGWAQDEALGRSAVALLYKDVTPERTEANKTVLAKGEWSGELRQVAKNGREVIVSSRWTLVRDHQNRPRAKLAINTDITEKKKLEGQLLRNQRLESIGTLAGGIAHDLNNVLAPIMMGIELLRPKVLDAASQSLLATLQASTERGADLVKQILAFARGSQGQRQIMELISLVRELAKLLQQTLPKNIHIHAHAASNLWPIVAESTQIHQVLMNLCVNARDAMPSGGKLTLAAENMRVDEKSASLHPNAKAGRYVVLTVEDSGSGMPPDIMDKIFDPFFTTKEIGKGTGLGLSTSLGIVQAHGGFIHVYSEVGKGTRFKVFLPALESTTIRKSPGSPSVELPQGHGELVLVVDDEVSIRQICKAILENNGYKVLLAADGLEALGEFKKQGDRVKAVITDMAMPTMDGPTTIRNLHEIDPKVPILAASGFLAGADTATNSERPFYFLPKPYTAESLLKALQSILRNGHHHVPAGT